MKTRLASILVFAAALSASFSASLNAAPKSAQAHAVRVRTVNNNGWEVSRGTSAQTLLNRFGAPDTKLSESVWVYQRFHAVADKPSSRSISKRRRTASPTSPRTRGSRPNRRSTAAGRST